MKLLQQLNEMNRRDSTRGYSMSNKIDCRSDEGWEYHRENSWEVYDARGIYLTRVCDRCERERLSGFRPDVLSDPNYWHDEPLGDESDELGLAEFDLIQSER